MSGRKLALDAAMWVTGLAAIAAFAWLVQWLDGTAVEVTEPAPVEQVEPDQPLAALTSGVARAAATARTELVEGSRSRAAHAVDAALRAAEVGHAASHGEVGTAFTIALHDIQATREALHGGNPDLAARHLRQAADALVGAVEPARGMSPAVPPRQVWPGFEGAVLVNANGSRIGRVLELEQAGRGPVAVLHVGGANDVLGFLNLGGETVRAPADHLLWGPRRSIGSVLVALPTASSEAGEILTGLP